jgi:hypothetical protein
VAHQRGVALRIRRVDLDVLLGFQFLAWASMSRSGFDFKSS